MRIACVLILALTLFGCGKPKPASRRSQPGPVPTFTTLKPQTPPEEIIWETSILNNTPAYLAPCEGAEKADPETVLERVQKELTTDKAANDLLKKLIRVETLTVAVVTGPAPEKITFAHQPRGEDDGLLTIYLQPGKRSEVKGRVFLDIHYSVISSRSSTLFRNAENFQPIKFAINDFLLRNKLGYVFKTGMTDWDKSKKVSAEERRRLLDARIKEHLRNNEMLPLRKKPQA